MIPGGKLSVLLVEDDSEEFLLHKNLIRKIPKITEPYQSAVNKESHQLVPQMKQPVVTRSTASRIHSVATAVFPMLKIVLKKLSFSRCRCDLGFTNCKYKYCNRSERGNFYSAI